jgi:hypothetical protein
VNLDPHITVYHYSTDETKTPQGNGNELPDRLACSSIPIFNYFVNNLFEHLLEVQPSHITEDGIRARIQATPAPPLGVSCSTKQFCSCGKRVGRKVRNPYHNSYCYYSLQCLWGQVDGLVLLVSQEEKSRH